MRAILQDKFGNLVSKNVLESRRVLEEEYGCIVLDDEGDVLKWIPRVARFTRQETSGGFNAIDKFFVEEV